MLSQTLEDIQIILVNDGSKDNSGNIAKEYEKNNKDRVIYVEKENGGLSDARNYGTLGIFRRPGSPDRKSIKENQKICRKN